MEPAQARPLLRAVEILAALPDGELDALMRELDWLPVNPCQEVLHHLARSTQVYFIAQGAFRFQMTTAYGRQVAIRHLRAGGHFGEIAALTGAPRSVSVIAEETGLLACCPGPAFLALMRRNAGLAEAVAASLARNVVLLTDRLFELAALEMRFRLYSELLRLARDGVCTEEGVQIRNAPTHDMLGAAIGAQREAVNRELQVLSAEGILRRRRREIVITDIDRLRDMVKRRAGLTATQVVDWHF
jgi:CRP-like cAMP-binding protein